MFGGTESAFTPTTDSWVRSIQDYHHFLNGKFSVSDSLDDQVKVGRTLWVVGFNRVEDGLDVGVAAFGDELLAGSHGWVSVDKSARGYF